MIYIYQEEQRSKYWALWNSCQDWWPIWRLTIENYSLGLITEETLKSLYKLPEIPTVSGLCSNPSCQTLSKGFEISKKFTVIPSEGLWSKSAQLLWKIDSSWFSQKSFGWKPDWLRESNLFPQGTQKMG